MKTIPMKFLWLREDVSLALKRMRTIFQQLISASGKIHTFGTGKESNPFFMPNLTALSAGQRFNPRMSHDPFGEGLLITGGGEGSRKAGAVSGKLFG